MDVGIFSLGRVHYGDCLTLLKQMPDGCIQTCVTSPPYWGLRDYGVDGQLGLEKTPEEYVEKMVVLFREVRRVLKDDGTLWLNLGDSYASSGDLTQGGSEKQRSNVGACNVRRGKLNHGLKPKDLVGIPWRTALALQADGWYLRSDIIWHKPNPMPESVTDRPTKSHEYIFLMSKSQKYYYDHEAIREPINPNNKGDVRCPALGQDRPKNSREMNERVYDTIKGANRRTVWTVTTKPYKEAHFATYPPDLIEPCILAGAPENGIVLDIFTGSGTSGEVAIKNNRQFIGMELNEEYLKLATERIEAAKLGVSIKEYRQGQMVLF